MVKNPIYVKQTREIAPAIRHQADRQYFLIIALVISTFVIAAPAFSSDEAPSGSWTRFNDVIRCNTLSKGAATGQDQSRIFDTLARCHFGLYSEINDNSDGASISYADTSGGSNNGLVSQFAAIYSPNPFYAAHRYKAAAILDVDGDIETGLYQPYNFLNFRSEVALRRSLDFGADEFVRFGPFFESNQNFAVQNAMAEVVLTFTRLNPGPLAIGSFNKVGDSGLAYRIRPFLTLQSGSNIIGLNQTNELSQTRLRIIPDMALDFSAPALAKNLLLSKINLKLEEVYSILPLEGQTVVRNGQTLHSNLNYQQFSSAFSIGLTPSTSLGITYAYGAVAPTYITTRSLRVNLQIAFGPSWAPSPTVTASN